MPLFQQNPIRSTGALLLAMGVGWMATRYLGSLHALHLTQTSVAILAILSLMYIVTIHHRREGHVMTQTQEEMILIGGFGLFWIAVLLAWRAYTQGSGHGDFDGTVSRGQDSYTGSVLPYPCRADDMYCIVEEWSFF
ncbi:hypothetical protein CPB85DRAFT_521624 [Mucidula mucida]|nr:hypothetical protein CPB85DRAFT_521624 [Mucidula mucida]